jgi:surfactin synthase thioesterase subunit
MRPEIQGAPDELLNDKSIVQFILPIIKMAIETSDAMAIHHFEGGHFFIDNLTGEINSITSDKKIEAIKLKEVHHPFRLQ